MVAYTAQQIVDLVNAGKGPADMYTGHDVASQLSKLHTEIAGDMKSLQQDMQPNWKGDAAGQAYAGAAPLVQASEVSGQHLAAVQNLYQGQGSSFADLHNKVGAVGNLGAKPSDDMFSDTPFSFLSNRADEIKAYNAKAQQVVDSYNVYHGQSTDNSGQWPAQANYGALGVAGDASLVKPVEPGGGTGTGNVSHLSSGGGPGGTAGHSGGGFSGGSGGGGVDNGGSGGSNGSGGPAGHGGPGSGSSSNPGGNPGTLPPGKTSTAGYVPPSSTAGDGGVGGGSGFGVPGTGGGSGSPSDSGFGPGGGFGPVGGFGPGGGSGYGSAGSTGSGSGYGSGSSGSGSSSGVRGSLGAGNSSGVGGAEGESAGGRAAGGSAAAGRPGAAGTGAGAMGRGGKGEGDEDTEHQRPAYLLENDPDEALIGELPRTSPPVIGL